MMGHILKRLQRMAIYSCLCVTVLLEGSLAQDALTKGSLYDNLIYSMPRSSGREVKSIEEDVANTLRGRKVIKPSATMLSGTVEDVNHHLEMAHIAMLQGRNLDAGWHYYYVAQKKPDLLLAQEGLALSIAKTGNVPVAHKMFRRLYETNPSEVRYRVQLAAAEFHLGEYEKSLLRLELPEGVQDNYDSLYLRGLCFYATGQIREAVESLQQAHNLELSRVEPLKAMVEIFASRKMREPVESLLQKLKVLAGPEDYASFRKQSIFSFLTEE